MNNNYRQSLKEAAKQYHAIGLLVTVADGKNPAIMGHQWHKQPRTLEGLERWIEKSPHPTIGLQAGPGPEGHATVGVILIDIDSDAELDAAKELFGGEFPNCWWIETGRGHRLVFRFSEERAIAGRASMHYKASNGVSVLVQFGTEGRGAHAIVPPSKHYMQDDKEGWKPTGRTYRWRMGNSPSDMGLTDFPVEATRNLQEQASAEEKNKAQREARLNGVDRREGDPDTGVDTAALEAMLQSTKNMTDASDGSRRLLVCACRAAEHYLGDACFIATLAAYEEEAGPFAKRYDDGELIDRLRQAEARPDVVVGRRLAQIAFDVWVPFQAFGLNDAANASRLTLLADGRFKYVTDLESWFVWSESEGRWAVDRGDLAINHCASQGLKPMVLQELMELLEEGRIREFAHQRDPVDAYRGFAQRSANLTQIAAAVKLARGKSALQLRAEDLDSDPYLIGTPSGTVDLRTGEVVVDRRSAFITKSTKVGLEPATNSTRWLQFMQETFDGDQEMIDFMRRLLGHALVGEQREHVLPVLFGSGANGKSVLIDTISTVLGDYAAAMPDGLLTVNRSDRHPTEVADLMGVRLAFAEETGQEAHLDEAKVKRLTGGSKLKARLMRKDFFQFEPSHTPFLITNHKPTIRGNDHGIWRRIHIIDFPHTVPVEKRDPDLKAKLLAEGGGILGWLVEGCRTYLEVGLMAPERVQAATALYRQQSDPFELFVAENLVETKSSDLLPFEDIKHRYDNWSLDNGKFVSDFPKRLKERFPDRQSRTESARGYRGLELLENGDYGLAV